MNIILSECLVVVSDLETFTDVVRMLGNAKSFYVEFSTYFPVNCFSAFRQIALNGTSKVLFMSNFLRRAVYSWMGLTPSRNTRLLPIREVYIYARHFMSHYSSKFQNLIATDFLKHFAKAEIYYHDIKRARKKIMPIILL